MLPTTPFLKMSALYYANERSVFLKSNGTRLHLSRRWENSREVESSQGRMPTREITPIGLCSSRMPLH